MAWAAWCVLACVACVFICLHGKKMKATGNENSTSCAKEQREKKMLVKNQLETPTSSAVLHAECYQLASGETPKKIRSKQEGKDEEEVFHHQP